MNYPFENDTSAVIKKLARKSVRFDKKKNLFCLSAIIVAVCIYCFSMWRMPFWNTACLY